MVRHRFLISTCKGSNPFTPIKLDKARDGIEPSFQDLQSHTLPLCYLATIFCGYKLIGKLSAFQADYMSSSLIIRNIKYYLV